jgi:hypothetical protein
MNSRFADDRGNQSDPHRTTRWCVTANMLILLRIQYSSKVVANVTFVGREVSMN